MIAAVLSETIKKIFFVDLFGLRSIMGESSNDASQYDVGMESIVDQPIRRRMEIR